MRITQLGIFALTLGTATGSVQAQQKPAVPAAPTAPTFLSEVNVNNITVDVQVREASGVPVAILHRDDFRVFEDGKEQALTNYLAVQGGQVAEAPDKALLGQPAPRMALLFFDLYQLIESDKRRIVETMRDQIAPGLPPAMTVAVVSFDGSLRVHTAPTSSTEKLLEALKAVDRLPATGLQRQIKLGAFDSRLGPQTMGVSPADPRFRYSSYEFRRTQNEEYWNEMRRMVGRVESAFAAAVQRFSGASARKVVVFVSPGFPRAENVPTYTAYDFWVDRPPEYRNVGVFGKAAFLASALEYTLYTLDPSGNQTQNIDASESGPPPARDAANAGFWREADRKDSLIQAARFTGGEALFTRDASVAMANVERETASFYSLGYQPAHAGDGKEHAIRVEIVGHPEYKLTYRAKYIDRPFEQRDAERTRAALLVGDAENPLGIELVLDKPQGRFKMGAQGMKLYRINAELRIPYAGLILVPRGTKSWGQVQVVVLATDPTGNQSDLVHQRVPIELPAEKVDEARKRGYFAFTFAIEIEGGERSLRVAVNDVLGHTTSGIIANMKL